MKLADESRLHNADRKVRKLRLQKLAERVDAEMVQRVRDVSLFRAAALTGLEVETVNHLKAWQNRMDSKAAREW